MRMQYIAYLLFYEDISRIVVCLMRLYNRDTNQ